jgi:hypothetical protein
MRVRPPLDAEVGHPSAESRLTALRDLACRSPRRRALLERPDPLGGLRKGVFDAVRIEDIPLPKVKGGPSAPDGDRTDRSERVRRLRQLAQTAMLG